MGMKHPEYDSPFELIMSDITTQTARNIDEMCWQAILRAGINVDKEKLLIALKQDSERYREAYANGYDTGYEKRDDEIVRCKDCEYACICSDDWVICTHIDSNGNDKHPVDWFCADGERKES